MAFHQQLVLILMLTWLTYVVALPPENSQEGFFQQRNLVCPRRESLNVVTPSSCPAAAAAAAATAATDETTSDTIKGQATEEASLVIRADYVGKSEPAPASSTEAMQEFFQDSSSRDCLISAGNTRETHPVPTTNKLLERWKVRAFALGAEEPSASDEIISVNTGGIKFPGITIQTTSLMGTKLLLPTKKTKCPSYEFILIQDEREVVGLRPIVWVYNQLVGGKDKEKETAPMCMSRITACPSSDNKNVTFQIDTFLEIRISFPAILLKILPVSKEKVEARGVKAIQRMLKKDIDVSLTKIRELYIAALQST